MLRRFALCALLLTLLCVLIPSATQAQSGQDLLTNSFQNCTGIPCMTVKNAAATGPWTGTKNLNDLMTYSFQSCSGIPCMTVTGISVTSSGSFGDLEGGTNTQATMIVGTGSTLSAGGGEINATSVPGTGITSAIPDAVIPDLNTLSTGLTPAKCVETDGAGHFVSATNACNVGAGGSGVWGGITGTLSNQTDLQTALNAKVPTSTTVNGHALTSNVSVTAADVGLSNVNNTSDAAKNSATAQLTNKQVVPRVQLLTVTANQVTPNADNTDVGYNYTFSAGLIVNTPTFTIPLVNQQLLAFEFSTTAPQALTWGSGYSKECGLELPTGTTGNVAGNPVYNRFLYRYSDTSLKWCLIANTKGDTTRVTTLAQAGTSPNYTFTCPVDNSDHCELQETRTTGTLTVQIPSGTPSNGQFVRYNFLCTNAQTVSWNAIYIASASFSLPTSCPADITKWLSVDLRYSTVLTKWQLLRGEVVGANLPATVVETDQANNYTTGAQNFGAATSLILPKAAGAAPTADGDVRYDTTQHLPVFGENGMLTSSPARLIYISDAGNSNNGQTGDFLHTGATITIPTNYMVSHRALRMCTYWRFTSTPSPGTLTFKVRLVSPATDLITHTVGAPTASKTNWTTSFCHIMVAKDAPGAAANVYTAAINSPDSFNNLINMNQISQPIGIATNAPWTITMVSRWNTPVAGNIITPDLFTVEALN